MYGVDALTNFKSIRFDQVGTYNLYSYIDNISSNTFNSVKINNLSFFATPNLSGVNSSTYSTRLTWNLPVSNLKDTDTLAFTVGMSGGQVSSSLFYISSNGSWLPCNPLATSGSTSTSVGYTFTSFSCNYDSSKLPSSGNIDIYIISYGTLLFNNNQGSNTRFAWLVDITFYSQTSTSVENAIIESTNKLNETQKETNDKLDEILDMEGGESTDSLDKDSVDDVDKAESELLDKETNTDDLEIDIDSESSNVIWIIIEDFITSNSRVFGLFISMLTLGIISLILNR